MANDHDGAQRRVQELDIALVGPCSAGKSTLVARLKSAGYTARAISQEHSYVPYMWQMNNPDVLIYLDLRLETLRRRRKANWSAALLAEQQRRLAHAREHADLYLATDNLLPDEVFARVAAFLSGYDPASRPARDEQAAFGRAAHEE